MSQQVADESHLLRYIHLLIEIRPRWKSYLYIFPTDASSECFYYYQSCLLSRRFRGEDLDGLSFEDLQQLEKSLEVGLSRIIETKVYASIN